MWHMSISLLTIFSIVRSLDSWAFCFCGRPWLYDNTYLLRVAAVRFFLEWWLE